MSSWAMAKQPREAFGRRRRWPAHYKLDNLVAIVDVNRLGQSQATMHGADGEAYAKKFGGFGWHTVVIDGHNLEQIRRRLLQRHRTRKASQRQSLR